MAPILSKAPARTTEEKIGRWVKKHSSLWESAFEILKDAGTLGKLCKADVETKFSYFRTQLDNACIGCVRLLESLCCLDLNRAARGGPTPPLTGTLPILFVVFIVVMLYNAFVFGYMPAAGIAVNSATSLTFHAWIFMLLMSFAQAVRTDPGSAPTTNKWCTQGQPPPEATERKHGVDEARWCRKSNAYKPDRAHYCRVLKKGVLRMDHYCPWLGNTVGFRNHKFFLLFLLYTNAACAQLGVSFLQLLLQYTLPALTTFCLVGAEGLTLLITTLLTPFFLFHLWLLCSNMTTIEFCERMRSKSEGEGEREGELDNQTRYDLGILRNICQVLGWNPLLWLFPVGGPAGDGITFPIRANLRHRQAATSRDRDADEKHAEEDHPDIDDGPEVTHPEAPKKRLKTIAEEGDEHNLQVDLEGAWDEEQEEEWQEEWQEASEECSEEACEDAESSRSVPDDGGFLVWRNAAEFVEDLTIGCQFIGEKTEDCTRGSLALLLTSCLPGPLGRKAAKRLTGSAFYSQSKQPLHDSRRVKRRRAAPAVKIVRPHGVEGEPGSGSEGSASSSGFSGFLSN